MLAPQCTCPNPQVFDTSDTCHTCGHSIPKPAASTHRLALALAEIALGRRRVGDRNARPDRKGSGRGRKAKGT